MYRLLGATLLAASVSIAQADTIKIFVSEQAQNTQIQTPSMANTWKLSAKITDLPSK